MSVTTYRTADHLPLHVSDRRSPLWWGFALMITIEIVVFGSLIAAYFYLKATTTLGAWPPEEIGRPDLLLPLISTGTLALSSLAVYIGDRRIARDDTRGLTLALLVSFALGVVFLVLKAIEYGDKGYRWDTHAYGSIVWTMVGFHAMHVISVLLKTTALIVLAARGHYRADRRIGVLVNGLYWHFVVIIWLPLFATIYLSPYVL
jgi:cytochrome c oxidase subunit III